MNHHARAHAAPVRLKSDAILKRLISLLIAVALVGGSLGSVSQAMAQQGATATPVSTATKPVSPGMGQQYPGGPDLATGPGAPAVLAQGLVYAPGTDIVWSVQEIKIPPVDKASPKTGQASILFQRAGSAIVRNDVTAKRALISPGAAYFIAGGDSYTVSGDGNAPTAWNFAIGNSSNVPGDAFYESPKITNVPEGSYPMTITRYVLRADEEASIGQHTGPALVMVASGQVQADAGSGPVSLSVRDGQLVANDGKVHNTGSSPAVYVVVALGAPVSDATAGAPQAPAATTPTTPATSEAPTSESVPAPTPSSANAVPAPPANGRGSTNANGDYIASINITAEAPLYLTVTVDGVTVFDGTLETGQMTGAMVGSVYQVTTSVGASTLFTDGCGKTFYMGNESGSASYTLTANADSCSPQ